jgi:hypothetical protein
MSQSPIQSSHDEVIQNKLTGKRSRYIKEENRVVFSWKMQSLFFICTFMICLLVVSIEKPILFKSMLFLTLVIPACFLVSLVFYVGTLLYYRITCKLVAATYTDEINSYGTDQQRINMTKSIRRK